MYYLYSTRMHGWWTGFNGTSDPTQAAQYPRDEAIAIAARHRDGLGSMSMFPVAVDDIAAVKEYKV